MQLNATDALLARTAMRQRWLLLLGLLCSVFAGGAGLVPAFVAGSLVDTLTAGRLSEVTHLAILILLATAAWGAFDALEGYVMRLASEWFGRDLRANLYERILRLSMSFFQSKVAGELINRTDGDVEVLVSAFERSIEPTMSSILAFGITIAVMFHTDRILTFVALTTVPLWSLVSRPAASRLNVLQTQLSRARDAFLAHTAEVLDFNGALLIKLQNAQLAERRRFERWYAPIVSLRLRQTLISRVTSATLMVIVGAAPALILATGAYLVAHHLTTVGTLVAFLSLQGRLYSPVSQIATLRLQFANVASVRARLSELVGAPEEPDAPVSASSSNELIVKDVEIAVLGRNLFEPISFTAVEGSFCALVGPSGVGKSTFASCLGRFMQPERGTIRLGTVPIEDLSLRDLRDRVAIVTQQSVFFTRDLRGNLTLGEREISDEQIMNALTVVSGTTILASLPNGLDTVIGTDVKLSGGEKQRLAIARALLRKPHLLVLDEATSALDPKTEREVLQAVRTHLTRATIVAITHRAEVARYADQVVEFRPRATLASTTAS